MSVISFLVLLTTENKTLCFIWSRIYGHHLIGTFRGGTHKKSNKQSSSSQNTIDLWRHPPFRRPSFKHLASHSKETLVFLLWFGLFGDLLSTYFGFLLDHWLKFKFKWLLFLKVLGTNAITAHVITHVLHFSKIAGFVIYGLALYYELITVIGGFALLYLLLWYMYKNKTFTKV